MLFLSRAAAPTAGAGVRHTEVGARLRYIFTRWIDPTQAHTREGLALNLLNKKYIAVLRAPAARAATTPGWAFRSMFCLDISLRSGSTLVRPNSKRVRV